MGGYATLHFGLMFPERARSLVVGGAGYGSASGERSKFHADTDYLVKQFDAGMEAVASFYSRGPTRVQFIAKDPVGWQEFHDRLASRLGARPRQHPARRAAAAALDLRAGAEARGAARCRRSS